MRLVPEKLRIEKLRIEIEKIEVSVRETEQRNGKKLNHSRLFQDCEDSHFCNPEELKCHDACTLAGITHNLIMDGCLGQNFFTSNIFFANTFIHCLCFSVWRWGTLYIQATQVPAKLSLSNTCLVNYTHLAFKANSTKDFHFSMNAISGQSAPVLMALKETHTTLVSRWP